MSVAVDSRRRNDEVDLWARVVVLDGCWHWTGQVNARTGYAFVSWQGRHQSAHRVMYELLRRQIPDGMYIDHLCRNRACVNPAHMEVVTNGENVLRGNSPSALAARATHCPAGHPYTPENTMNCVSGYRRCRACNRAQHKLRPSRAAALGKDGK